MILIGFLLAATAIVVPLANGEDIPPPPAHAETGQNSESDTTGQERVADLINSWTENDPENIWELSGLFEGDILHDPRNKNGLVDDYYWWKNGTVPYYFEHGHFDSDGHARVMRAIDEFHKRTCIVFHPYVHTDEQWIVFRSNSSGCYSSSIGMEQNGQVVNLQTPGCLNHGTLLHELLHVLGFFHEHSSHNRDDYVTIAWKNIEDNKGINFEKYNAKEVTHFGVGYDYGSIMHYSSVAFSRNGQPTVIPLKQGAEIGQRRDFSPEDLKKLDHMYEKMCKNRKKPTMMHQVNALIDSVNNNPNIADSENEIDYFERN